MSIETFIEQSQHIECRYKVTEEVYKAFQMVSGDMNPLHTDADFAKSKGMQDRVMYGNILNAFISHFVGMQLPSPDVIILAQDINYHQPVYLNDEIVLDAEVDEYSEAVKMVSFKLLIFKVLDNSKQKVAKGHVQIKLI